MIQIPTYDQAGKQTGNIELDEALFGGEVRPALLKQAYVRYHANRRAVNTPTKSRGMVEGSTKKLYKQKGTGNARRGDRKSNILRGGGHGKAKVQHDWNLDMPVKQRRLANRNAILAKAIDGEIRLLDSLAFAQPSTKAFKAVLEAVQCPQSVLVAFADTRDAAAKSAKNIDGATVTQIDRLNAFDLLNHRFLVADKAAFEAYVARVTASVKKEVA